MREAKVVKRTSFSMYTYCSCDCVESEQLISLSLLLRAKKVFYCSTTTTALYYTVKIDVADKKAQAQPH